MSRYVDLSEKVTATYYDEQYEEWTQQTVTIADVLDSVCDDYTVLPTIEPRKKGKWLLDGRCSVCLEHILASHSNYCPNCGAQMTE